ncbi:hypothetical protein DespoDRAFT_03730 [Desulfobacter postgatei 2ac9]|uniref:Uncharacterized protein n=1 Tax=Desulfobacter postgatei 2ac9 TaxID=879212 RepID=I5B7K4_9BACT|nr:hypothetical protein DespoDRAFT_03730 [Desulfobacter postgatei 2ac9]
MIIYYWEYGPSSQILSTISIDPYLALQKEKSGDIYDKFCQGENVDFPSLFKDILQKR